MCVRQPRQSIAPRSKQGRDDFQTSATNAWNLRQIEVTDRDVGRLAPPSRQMRATATSTAKPLRPRAPDTAYANRWWPTLLRRRPHPRVCKGNGNRSRRTSNVRKSSVNPFVQRNSWANSGMAPLPRGHPVTTPELSRSRLRMARVPQC